MARLRPIAKALAPLVLALVAAAIQWAATGTFDAAEAWTTATGLAAAAGVYVVPNTPGPPPPPIDVPPPPEGAPTRLARSWERP